jgi:coatomer protein complex subunit epsilon
MDPYSTEGELINIHSHFHQGQYQEVVRRITKVFSRDVFRDNTYTQL